MQNNQLIRLKAWFKAYTHSFLTGDTQTDSPLVLKIAHTARVCDNMCLLGRSVDLTDGQMCLAETVGLFHDLGRFEQYRRFRTFNDRQSACTDNVCMQRVGVDEVFELACRVLDERLKT